jgi:hypothetical protein
MFLRSRYVTLKGYDVVANRLLARLSDNGVDVDMVIAALTFEFGSALAEINMRGPLWSPAPIISRFCEPAFGRESRRPAR